MITGLLLQALGAMVSAVLGVLPAIPVPSWLADGGGWISTVFGYAASMSVWLPFPLLLTVVGAYLAVKVTAFSIKIARIVVSFLTLGGGSAS